MNNEPVAYVNSMCNDYIDWKADPISIDGQPLYTHPVSKAKDRFSNYESICLQCGTTIYKPFKELTDKEIDDALYVADITLNNLSDGDISMERIKAFARAILRKAQE